MTKKNLGDDFSPENLDKFKWKNPKPRPEKLIQNLPAPLPNIDLPNIDQKEKVQAPKFHLWKIKKCISRYVVQEILHQLTQAPKFIYGVLIFDF